MARSHSSSVPDTKMPALKPTEAGLRTAVDENERIQVNVAKPAVLVSKLNNLATSLQGNSPLNGPSTDCRRTFWLSFFFDGTGNNMDADIDLFKHSNIVRLFRVHKQTSDVYKIYIPGVGTYFQKVGDEGGSSLGLGCGAMGDARINFALREFDNILAKPLSEAKNPRNSIKEINLAVFGFSRGAALARAFTNDFIKRNCLVKDGRWVLKWGGWPVRIRFIGLFDTVASVGIPMSSNNIPTSGAKTAYNENIQKMLKNRLREYPNTQPVELAFSTNGIAGADPAPGRNSGHDGWGARLQIDGMVEEVRHFVAAHEIRNSFPLDSISVSTTSGIVKPAHFHEIVYPGAHSDVGGGYAPGEGAKGILPTECLSLIPLRHMYEQALRSGVPMLPELSWAQENHDDFKVSQNLLKTFNHYVKVLGEAPFLGQALNNSMRLYFTWRFKAIRKRRADGKLETEMVRELDEDFREKDLALNKEIAVLEKKVEAANLNLEIQNELQKYRDSGSNDPFVKKDDSLRKAKDVHTEAVDQLLRAKARKNSLPNMQNFRRNIDLYDNQLIDDTISISEVLGRKNRGLSAVARSRANFRPHYKNLFEAFENEHLKKTDGLIDEILMQFFDRYVHDSLCGFGKDATLPSDPRVIFMGGDLKFRYASLENFNDNPFEDNKTALA